MKTKQLATNPVAELIKQLGFTDITVSKELSDLPLAVNTGNSSWIIYVALSNIQKGQPDYLAIKIDTINRYVHIMGKRFFACSLSTWGKAAYNDVVAMLINHC